MENQNKRAIDMIQRDIDNLNLTLKLKREDLDRLLKNVDKKHLEIEVVESQIEEQKLALKKLQSE